MNEGGIIRRAALLLATLLPLLWTAPSPAGQVVRMATTTSTQNSGLLERLLPPFTNATGIEVQVIAVGTGKALKMARDGDVDLVMVHAPRAERAFVDGGYGIDRRGFMENDFLLVGPASDPAGVAGARSAVDAMKRIARSHSRFVSRGDDSGTHKKERLLWTRAGTEPGGDWYLEAGQGMGRVLQMASELGAYTLTDRGTWLAHQAELDLAPLYAGGSLLANPYGIIAVNPARHPDARYREARRLIDWICGSRAQSIIRDYRVKGEPLFRPTCAD
ncbi:MAG TPA: tungsten ABC transporter substrate-binding protein [Sedimenticola thiotaurini]|uniref:Tungsten ABC transporter substrate-binding protein n=1 Tax=Sedimenticola thiotaurini TaxID=1543721 RepID=A0A831RHW6_9GAMM|nr:tungsten ABC transporter substrate-binding protein [Sedimenticola thiotaurini]